MAVIDWLRNKYNQAKQVQQRFIQPQANFVQRNIVNSVQRITQNPQVRQTARSFAPIVSPISLLNKNVRQQQVSNYQVAKPKISKFMNTPIQNQLGIQNWQPKSWVGKLAFGTAEERARMAKGSQDFLKVNSPEAKEYAYNQALNAGFMSGGMSNIGKNTARAIAKGVSKNVSKKTLEKIVKVGEQKLSPILNKVKPKPGEVVSNGGKNIEVINGKSYRPLNDGEKVQKGDLVNNYMQGSDYKPAETAQGKNVYGETVQGGHIGKLANNPNSTFFAMREVSPTGVGEVGGVTPRMGETSSSRPVVEAQSQVKSGTIPSRPLGQQPSTPGSQLNNSYSFDNNVPQLTTPVKPLALPEGQIVAKNKKELIKLRQEGRDAVLVTKQGKQINLTEKSTDLNPEVVREQVRANLQQKFDNLEKGVYGSATSELQGGKKGAGLIARVTRPIQEKVSGLVGGGLGSQNPVKRAIARGIRGLFGGSGNTAEITSRLGNYRGGVQSAENLANDFMKLGDEMLPNNLSKEKVWSFLDPELSKVKVTEADLSPAELDAVRTLREASDLINDTNFSMGKISHETWLKGKDGKYITRAYEDYDLPPELSEAFTKGKGKLDLGAYKKRGDVTDWKEENAIKDPFYLASKRIQSTFQNKAITDYGNWLSKDKNLVSDIEKAGYTQLSESPMWGALSGKYVRKDIMEGIRGFYFDSKGLQGGYDLLKAYDQNPVRQLLKKTKTVYNPATRLGNQTSNRVFAAFNGINPITFEKNMQLFAKNELKNNGQYTRYLRQNGVLGNDMTKYELVQQLAKDGVEPGTIKKIDDFVAGSYGAADEQAKLSAFKYWLDKGKTKEEALAKVRNGFQDYSKVGLYYDVMSRFPLIGKPFVRFQSELIRIIKNSAMENPLSLGAVVGSIALAGHYASRLSGETPEDRKTREGRFGTPVIPFTQIPLVFQTPYGEVNVARMFGMYETAGADTKNKNIAQRVSKYLPTDIPTSKEDVMKMLGNDVFAGGLINLITDTDFRGKSIADPNQNKYQPTTLTKGEQWANRAKYLGYNYNAPFANDLINVYQAAKGKVDQYGNTKTVKQALTKLTGLKVTQFGSKEAEAQRIKDAEYNQYSKDDKSKKINLINKQLMNGEIDQNTADKRIKSVGGSDTEVKSSNEIKFNPISKKYQILDDNGDIKNFKTSQAAEMELAGRDFLDSGENFQVYQDKVFRKDNTEKGYSVKTKISYDTDLTTQKLENAKTADNLGEWAKLYEVQKKNLTTQLQDSSLDELERLELQQKYDKLEADAAKYAGYGGFTKPKKGKKLTAPKLSSLTVKVPSAKKPTIKLTTMQKVSGGQIGRGPRAIRAKKMF